MSHSSYGNDAKLASDVYKLSKTPPNQVNITPPVTPPENRNPLTEDDTNVLFAPDKDKTLLEPDTDKNGEYNVKYKFLKNNSIQLSDKHFYLFYGKENYMIRLGKFINSTLNADKTISCYFYGYIDTVKGVISYVFQVKFKKHSIFNKKYEIQDVYFFSETNNVWKPFSVKNPKFKLNDKTLSALGTGPVYNESWPYSNGGGGKKSRKLRKRRPSTRRRKSNKTARRRTSRK